MNANTFDTIHHPLRHLKQCLQEIIAYDTGMTARNLKYVFSVEELKHVFKHTITPNEQFCYITEQCDPLRRTSDDTKYPTSMITIYGVYELLYHSQDAIGDEFFILLEYIR